MPGVGRGLFRQPPAPQTRRVWVPPAAPVYTGYEKVIRDDSPVGYWRLGEPSGNWSDSGSAGNTLSPAGAGHTYGVAGGIVGDANPALTLPGGSGIAAQNASPTGLPTGAAVRSAEVWFKATTTADYNTILSYGNATNYQLWHMALTTIGGSTGEIYFYNNYDNSNFYTNLNLTDGAWHHVVLVQESSTSLRCYIDGSTDNVTSTNPVTLSGACATTLNAQGLVIGAGASWAALYDTFDGSLDEVAIYDAALTAAQVKRHYLAGAASYFNAVLTDAPVSYWRLGEPSGTTAADEMGANDGTYVNTPTLGVAGPLGSATVPDADTAITFVRANVEYVSTASMTGIPLGSAARSVEFWMNVPAALNWNAAVGWGTAAQYQRFEVGYSGSPGGKLWMHNSDGEWFFGADNAAIGNGWHHVVFVLESATSLRCYLDGADLGAQTTTTINTIADASYVEIGGACHWSGGSTFEGSLDEVAIYDTALSGTRILAHYNAGASSGPQTVTLGLVDGGAAIYAPAIQPDQFVTVGLLDGGATIYALTAMPDQFVTFTAVLDGTAAIYDLTLTPKNTITVGLLDGGAAIYALSAEPDQFVTLTAVLDGGATIYALTVANVGGATQTIGAIDLLDSGATIYALAAGFTVALPLVDSSAAIYAPSVGFTITIGLLDAGNAIYAITLTPKNTITVGLLDGAAAIYALAAGFTIILPLADGGAAVYALTIPPPTAPVVLPLVDGNAAIYAATLTQASGTQTIGPVDLLDGAAAIYAVTLLPVNTLQVGLIDGGAAIYAPSVGFTIILPLIDGAAQSFDLTVPPPTAPIVLPLVDGGATIYAPTVVGIAVTVVLPLADGGSAAYTLTVALASVAIAGYTRNQFGAIIPNCTVDLFRSSDNAYIGTTSSDALGHYSIMAVPGVSYFLVAYSAAKVYGVTARDIVGV
jgi:hypothetical protein